MGSAQIGLILKNSKIAVSRNLDNVTPGELAEIILNLELEIKDLQNSYHRVKVEK